MARALRIQFPGAFYHVTSRGNERQPVFKSPRDREKFLFYSDKKLGKLIRKMVKELTLSNV